MLKWLNDFNILLTNNSIRINAYKYRRFRMFKIVEIVEH